MFIYPGLARRLQIIDFKTLTPVVSYFVVGKKVLTDVAVQGCQVSESWIPIGDVGNDFIFGNFARLTGYSADYISLDQFIYLTGDMDAVDMADFGDITDENGNSSVVFLCICRS